METEKEYVCGIPRPPQVQMASYAGALSNLSLVARSASGSGINHDSNSPKMVPAFLTRWRGSWRRWRAASSSASTAQVKCAPWSLTPRDLRRRARSP